MTEAEWLACDDPKAMFTLVGGRMSPRQARLFACACGRRYCHIWESSAAVDEYYRRVKPAVDASCEAVIREAEDMPGGTLSRETVTELLARLDEGAPIGLRNDMIQTIRGNAAWWAGRFTDVPQTARQQGMLDASELRAREETNRFGSTLLRCICGGLAIQAAIDPLWLTSTVLALAEGIYAQRAFDRMPILADALQDAGCEDPAILNHCRSDEQHFHGCWVVDLILGKGDR